ncbi:MAG: radical SAM protein [Theionarchaea archaeon]|nr:radical SAM protein [Theionarchaea archaeon]
MKEGYPVLKEDIFLAKIKTPSGFKVKVRNTTTEQNFTATPLMFIVLELCTGTNTVPEIIKTLCGEAHSSDAVIKNIESIVKLLLENNIITMNKTPSKGRSIKEIKLKYPLEAAQIEITNKCNLSCLHCFNNSGNPHPHELTTQEILSAIDALSRGGVHQITMTGGEPLLHPHIFNIIEHARKAPMSVDLFTNGTLITEDMVNQFKNRIRRFNISLDSVDASIHDTFRGKKGALEKTLQAITLLKEAGFPMKFTISLSQLNKSTIKDVLRYFKENNLTEFTITPVRYSGRGKTDITVSLEEYYQVSKEYLTYCKQEFPEGILKKHKKERDECSIARRSMLIKSDGTIFSCPGCDRGPAIGNVRDTDLETLWEHDGLLDKIRGITANTDTTCKMCAYLDFCVGCVAGAYSFQETLRCCYPFLCILNRAYDEVVGFT